ncbi:MAG: hypothetical protein GXP16_03950, partial [Gammaproteobacteria bacterium]|nr:hypothetical protein [Gammaproteobacteria bacterium]
MLTRKCRWVRLALVAVWIALPTHVFALGLGEIEVESALNQKFSATIDLVDSDGFQASEVLVSMASREDFERVGVERFFYLTNINFEVDLKAQRVVVSSSQPIAEPYLNFIVELHWPQGRLLKEFTVLLDPPTFSQAAAPQVSAPVQQDTQPQRQPAPAGRPAQSSNAGTQVSLSPSQRPSAPRNADGLMTSRDDTLWKIAQSTLPSDRVNVNQQMLAIQRLNPKAFIRNNINLLKAGYVLRIPSESESLMLSANDAKLVVNDQTDDWRTGETSSRQALADAGTQLIDDADDLRSQVDATDSPSSTSSTQSDAQGQVRIVANSGELAQGTGTGDSPSSSQLVETNEELNRQVDELTYQLDREQDLATNQIELKDRQLEVKNQQLAEMQEQVKGIEEQLAIAKQNQTQSTPVDKEPTPWWSSPMIMGGVIGILVLLL